MIKNDCMKYLRSYWTLSVHIGRPFGLPERKADGVCKKCFHETGKLPFEYALDCLKANTTEVRNIKAYILTTLYNSRFYNGELLYKPCSSRYAVSF
jgi:hypothetical protein